MVQHKKNIQIVFLSSVLGFLCLVFASTIQAKARLPANIKQIILAGDYQAALPLLRELADTGNSAALYQIALFYLKGQGVEKSVKQGVSVK